MTIAVTRTEPTAHDLRRHAAGTGEATVVRRLLALVLDGRNRADTARLAGMGRQTLRDWIHRYNTDGIAGLEDRHGGGPKPRLSAAQQAEVANWMRTGPDVAQDKVVRWRCVDLQARIARLFGVTFQERSVGRLLHRLPFSHVSTRPRHPKADLAAQASFATGSRLL